MINYKTKTLVLILMLMSLNHYGQLSTSVAMSKVDDQKKSDFLIKYHLLEEKVKQKISKNYSGKVKSKLTDQYKSYATDFVADIAKNQYIFSEGMDSLLQSILSKINHPMVVAMKKDINFIIAKDYKYNAYCTPEGIVIINMAVFKYAENEDQIAAVICHELAHHLLNHYLGISAKYIEDEISKDSKSQLKSIKHFDGAAAKAMVMLKKKLYLNSKLKRSHEFQADSLGFEIYKQSSYSQGSFLNSLELMSQFDSITYDTKIDSTIYNVLFDLPTLKFKPEWLKNEDLKSYVYFKKPEVMSADSLASHPEIEDRVLRLSEKYNLKQDTQTIEKSVAFKRIKKEVKSELVPLLCHNEEYGYALFATIYNMDKSRGTDNFDYYKSWLGILFEKLLEGRQTYTFNRYVEKYSNNIKDEDYKSFLNFMWALNTSDFKIISEHYKPFIKN